MEVVLVIASILLLASVAAAVALDRGVFAGHSATALVLPPGRPPAASGRNAGVRACDDLQAQLRSGRLSCADYRRAMAEVAQSHDRRHPLLVPGDD